MFENNRSHVTTYIPTYMFLNVDKITDTIYKYHLLNIHILYFTGGHFHPESLGNMMINNITEILITSIMLIVQMGPLVILVIV